MEDIGRGYNQLQLDCDSSFTIGKIDKMFNLLMENDKEFFDRIKLKVYDNLESQLKSDEGKVKNQHSERPTICSPTKTLFQSSPPLSGHEFCGSVFIDDDLYIGSFKEGVPDGYGVRDYIFCMSLYTENKKYIYAFLNLLYLHI